MKDKVNHEAVRDLPVSNADLRVVPPLNVCDEETAKQNIKPETQMPLGKRPIMTIERAIDKEIPDIDSYSRQPLTSGNGGDKAVIDALLKQNQELVQTISRMMSTMAQGKASKIMPPGKFHLNEGQTLIQFLGAFERYCENKYPSSQDGMLPLLVSYLEEPILSVYKSIIRTTYDYTTIKSKLLEWYKTYLNKEQDDELNKFLEAQMETNETIPLFAIRLEGLAQEAFPENDVKKMRILRKKFLEALPHSVQSQVRTSLKFMETTLGIKISWEKVVEAAEDVSVAGGGFVIAGSANTQPEIIDLTRNVPFNVVDMMQRPLAICEKADVGQRSQETPYREEDVLPQRSNSDENRYSTRGNRSYRGNVQRHQNTGAIPKNNNTPQRNSRSFSQTNKLSPLRNNNRTSDGNLGTTICNFCKKSGHLMRNCRSRPFCKFCGNRGHTYDNCYLAQNRCLHCHETGHLVQNCTSRYDDDLQCPRCDGDDHLGKDCPTINRPGN